MPSQAKVLVPEMLRGTVVTHRRRCGKPNCRCADGEALHERVVLSYSEASRTRFLSLPEEMIEPVRRATERYRQARARLEAKGNAGIAELERSLRSVLHASPRSSSRPPTRSTRGS